MRRTDRGLEIKVGIFVLIALLLLGYLSIKLGEETISTKKGYPVSAVFDDVSGLVVGARVEMAGVEIGRVADIRLTDGKALVEMNIYEGIKLTKDAEAMVRTKGVLGDRYIEIRQGKSPEVLPPGGMIAKTISPVDLDQILAQVGPAIQNLEDITEGLKEFLGSKEGKENLSQMITNIKEAAAAFRDVGQKLARGEGTLGKLLVDDTLYQRINSLAANLDEVSQKLNKGQGTLGKLISDETLYQDVKETVQNINQAAASFKKFAQKLESGQGTLGKLLADDELYNNLNETIASLKRVAEKIDKGEGTLGKLVNDDSLYFEAKKTLQSVNQAATGVQEQMPVTILGTIGTMALQ